MSKKCELYCKIASYKTSPVTRPRPTDVNFKPEPNVDSLAKKVIHKMYDHDWFSQWLGIEILEINTGSCKLQMTVRKEMLNGFAIAHGGITYSLADTAFAFACNSHGQKSVSVETSISHTLSLKEGDVITATASELHKSNKIGVYQIDITNQEGKLVALFKGTCYRTSKHWEV